MPLNNPRTIQVRPDYAQLPPDPDLIDVTTKTWFDSLKPELTDVAQKMVQQLGRQPLSQRKGLIPNLLADEISRIEREKWQLV
jgi:hypothetical protein